MTPTDLLGESLRRIVGREDLQAPPIELEYKFSLNKMKFNRGKSRLNRCAYGKEF